MMSPDHPTPDEQRLRALLHDAAAEVSPGDRLGQIRRGTASSRARRARWWPVVLGAGVATAAVVVGTVVLTQPGEPERAEPPVASPRTTTDAGAATPLYFLGDTVNGERLFREFQSIAVADEEQQVAAALDALTEAVGPDDPDYRTIWPAGSFGAVSVGDDAVTVELASDRALGAPAGNTPVARRLALQQVVYTAEAVIGDDLPVSFVHDGAPARRVLGVPVGATVPRDRQYDVVTPVSISDPGERTTVAAGETWVARGTASDFVTEVEYVVRDADDAVVPGSAGTVPVTADAGTVAFPGWETPEIDLDLAPGDYLFEATVVTIGQTSDSPDVYIDTRTIEVR
jgi:hypothetical protein